MAKRKRKRSRGRTGRKIYKKKSTAKKACGKGQSPYKVKGGWRVSKRRKR